MSPETEALRRQASEDMQDIAELRQCKGFQRYWLRQLRMRRDSLVKSLINDPPSKVDKEEREVIRRMILFCEEMERMPQTHASIAEAILRQ